MIHQGTSLSITLGINSAYAVDVDNVVFQALFRHNILSVNLGSNVTVVLLALVKGCLSSLLRK